MEDTCAEELHGVNSNTADLEGETENPSIYDEIASKKRKPSLDDDTKNVKKPRAQDKSDDVPGASDEISSTESLSQEIRTFIISWAENIDKNINEDQDQQPTEEEVGILKDFILDLDKRVENEKKTQVEKGSPSKCETSDVHPEDTTPNTGIPTTLLELIHYILKVFNDERLKELEFMVVLRDPDSILKYRSLVQFKTAMEGVQPDTITHVILGEPRYTLKSIQKAYDDIQLMLCTPEALIKAINGISSTTPEAEVLPWEQSLVEPTNKNDLLRISFCSDNSKASAIVVSGESGSGKTWFCQNYIPNKLGARDTALIYYSIVDGDGHEMIQPDTTFKDEKLACEIGMSYLHEASRTDGDVYRCISNLATEYNKGRDSKAHVWLLAKVGEILDKETVTSTWWKSKDKKAVKKLVLVVDELGKNPELGRALVSNVRDLYRELLSRGKAQQSLLVLVGSGLERHIRYDFVSNFEVQKDRTKIASFGTDPMKSGVIILRGPDLKRRDNVDGIPTKAILRGAYSKVLSTNTRMLTRGVLPMMKDAKFSKDVPETEMSERCEMWGSVNIAMDYAVRNYMDLNGLASIKNDARKVKMILLKQFKLLLHVSLVNMKHNNPASADIVQRLNVAVTTDIEEISRYGLVTADVKSTSPALRYLACNGKTAPVLARDGIGFEIMFQYHLVRLFEACNNEAGATHWVGQYNLSQAWPPPSAKGDKLQDSMGTEKAVEKRYKNDRLAGGNKANDIDAIVDLLRDKEYVDLVMRQTVSNAQGADLMILSKNSGKVALHLFQCKNVESIPRMGSKAFVDYFCSLGVKIDLNAANIEVKPRSGSAGYSYLGTDYFAKKLGEKLGTKVNIDTRYMVFSKEWDGGGDSTFLEKASEKGVMVWTREMLEPTISALPSKTHDAKSFETDVEVST